MNVFIGQTTPSQNRRCQLTGRTFGPTMRHKVGYVVQAKKDGKNFNYYVATRELAIKLKKQILEKE